MDTLEAHANLEALRQNSYPGRGIVVGMDESGKYYAQACWTMGRSEKSRNRVYEQDKKDPGRIFTEAADPTKMKEEDRANIIYTAMAEGDDVLAVTNGVQTDGIISTVPYGLSFSRAMQNYTYEPDFPNSTPRISAICTPQETHVAEMAILRKSPWSDACERHYYSYEELPRGMGHCLTTYMSDGNPLPSFRGEPFLLPLEGGIQSVADTPWNALNEENRVSLATKFIHKDSLKSTIRIINKYEKIS